jgi:hypothetical protein
MPFRVKAVGIEHVTKLRAGFPGSHQFIDPTENFWFVICAELSLQD